ncbi:transposase [Flavobacterium sp. TMP13]|uniref:transposase n=1 Tax=Flavobacterium sp. TMP13 TaxID=3425950 RepID=UPI003D77FAEA
MSYNIQAAVDAKHNLIVATHTVNHNDLNALGTIAIEAKENLGVDNFTILVDKGYHSGREINQFINHNITTIVADPTPGTSKESVTQPDYFCF